MNSTLKIESLHNDDLAAVVDLMKVQLENHGMECSVDGLSDVLTRIQMDSRYGFTVVAKVNGKIVGFALGTLIMSPEHEGLVAWLEEFYLIPEERGHGIGTQLLEAFLAKAQEMGVTAIDLEVDIAHEKVISLYQRCGFEALPRKRFFKRLQGAA